MIEQMNPSSRVWIYQSSRKLSQSEARQIEQALLQFTRDWVAHQLPLTAAGSVVDNRFIVLMVDEGKQGASGCSIDKSVHFLQHLGQQFDTNFFERMEFVIEVDGKEETLTRQKFKEAYQDGRINDATLVYDTLVRTKADFDASFRKPLADSWHRRLV